MDRDPNKHEELGLHGFGNVADPTLVAVLAHLTDSIKLLTLAQLASTETERNEIRSKVGSG